MKVDARSLDVVVSQKLLFIHNFPAIDSMTPKLAK